MIEDLWYRNAVIYCLDVEKYLDASGDGIGDFAGLERKVDYLASLGVTCLWLQPFYPTPNQDNGYDVSEFYGVDSRLGTLGEFVDFMNHAHQIGLRVIVDLVASHTSREHRWFQDARRGPESPFHDWYVWADERPEDHADGVVFPPVQETTWSWDEEAGKYYFHRFYEFQPDLDTWNPRVRQEILRIIGFWLQLGVSGFRMDAVPFLIERKGAGVEAEQDFEMLHDMRDFLQWRVRDAILLAEANVLPEESGDYFGESGERLQMILNFPVNQRLFYAMATGDLGPLERALDDTRDPPRNAQWVHFLRSHDELDLGRLSDEQRERVFAAFAPEESMQLYRRGIRRRLAPMLGNDRRRLELAFSLLFTLPGTPMLQYGDEIGLGDDLSLEGRESARTPMQWTSHDNGGFTTSDDPVRPVVDEGEYGYRTLNVAAQQRDPGSLFNWMGRTIRRRRECPEISWGSWRFLETDAGDVLAMRYDWRGRHLIALHNFSDEERTVRLAADDAEAERLVDVLDTDDSEGDDDGRHRVELPAYGYRWFRPDTLDADVPTG